MPKKSHNITFATLFGKNGETSDYTGLQLDFESLVENNVSCFSVNGNVVSVEGTSLSVVLPQATAIGVDDASGNWVINGIVTSARARGIDGTVSFDELSMDQKRELTFTEAVVTTLHPWENASATLIDETDDGTEFGEMKRTLSLSIPKGDRGDVMFATFEIDETGMLNMNVDPQYRGIKFSIDSQGYLEFDTGDLMEDEAETIEVQEEGQDG